MIKAILFDLDGTLINTNELIIKTFKHTLKKHLNLEASREEIIKTFGEPLEDTMQKYDEKNVELMISIYREYNEIYHDSLVNRFNGVDMGLKLLKNNGLKLGVVTSKRRSMAERGLKLVNIFDYMDVIITPEDTDKHKPHPEPVLKACEFLDISPKEALMVGDSHNDILSGKNAGCDTCLVKYTALPLEDILQHSPEYVIDSIEEIVEIVKSLPEVLY